MKNLQKLGYIALGAVMALTLNVTVPTLAAGTENVVKQLTAYFTSGGKPITIYVDGETVNITQKDSNGNVVQPFVSDGATYLPVKTVAEAFGKTAEWEGSTASVYIGKRPGAEQYMTDICPAYETGSEGLYTEYSAIASGGASSFAMTGVKYLNGMTFRSTGHFPEKDWAVYNLNGQYAAISAVLAHVDGTDVHVHGGGQDIFGNPVGGDKLQVFADGKLVGEYELTTDMSPKNIPLDVKGVNQLKLVWNTGDWSGGTNVYGFGNPVLR
ncbi:hypothetical protein FACS189490_13190 [Clostridia bacterium]|nr:hypothetical protein FACS189490_13190 [Clostridia bacterium]